MSLTNASMSRCTESRLSRFTRAVDAVAMAVMSATNPPARIFFTIAACLPHEWANYPVQHGHTGSNAGVPEAISCREFLPFVWRVNFDPVFLGGPRDQPVEKHRALFHGHVRGVRFHRQDHRLAVAQMHALPSPKLAHRCELRRLNRTAHRLGELQERLRVP